MNYIILRTLLSTRVVDFLNIVRGDGGVHKGVGGDGGSRIEPQH